MRVTAAEAAMVIFDVCKEVLVAGKKSAGYNGKAIFETPLGKLTAPKLNEACRKERSKLREAKKGFSWQVRVEALRDRLNDSHKQLKQAAELESADERITLLSAAMGGLQECSERATTLPKERGADHGFKVQSIRGKLNVSGLGKACDKMRQEALVAADLAIADKQLDEFIKTCNGDEVEVARRERLPAKIERIGKGRVFIYTATVKGRRTTRRFAFDEKGKRVDEKLLSSKLKPGPQQFERTSDGQTLPLPDLEGPK